MNKTEIKEVIELQNKAYGLLNWMKKGMDKGFIQPESAHKAMSMSEVTKHWFIYHIHNLPLKYRPNIDDENELNQFVNLFSTFLLTSFDIINNPGQRLYSEDAHCFCPMCSYLISVSHLKPKKLSKKNKHKAQKLKLQALQKFCADESLRCSSDKVELVASDQEIQESVAILTYTYQLLQRAKGISEGPAVLVLWREFAWNKNGSPKRRFKFDVQMVEDAKIVIVKYLVN